MDEPCSNTPYTYTREATDRGGVSSTRSKERLVSILIPCVCFLAEDADAHQHLRGSFDGSWRHFRPHVPRNALEDSIHFGRMSGIGEASQENVFGQHP